MVCFNGVQEVRFEAGEEIFRVNEEAAQMFIIEEGGVSMMTSFISLSQDEQEVRFRCCRARVSHILR